MRKILTLLLSLISIVAMADNRRLLTMEEAIIGRQFTPASYRVLWCEEYPKEFLHPTDSLCYAIDVVSGKSRVVELPEREKATVKSVGNNIVWVEEDGTERAVTNFTDKNIVAGSSVSRNEFGIDGGLFLSPNKRLLAFYQKDESAVTTFPLLDITTRTGSLFEI